MYKKIITLTILFILLSNINSINASNTKNNDINEKPESINKINLLDPTIKILMKIGHMPSISACAIKEDEVIWKQGYGYANIKNKTKASTDTIYSIGSITKTFTATAILQLYEKGLFNLDDNVSKYLPFDLKNPNYPNTNITFRMLLSHTSSRFDVINRRPDETSQYNYFEYLQWVREANGYFFNNTHQSIHEFVMDFYAPNGSRYDPNLWADYPPGTKYNYSNDGIIILGYLIERITGESYYDYLQENIFDPLEMKNTSFYLKDFNKNKLAVPYYRIAGFYIPLDHFKTSGRAPCGGLKSTIDDLSKYLMSHMNNGTYKEARILENETISLMHSIHAINKNQGTGYGFGWKIINKTDGEIEEGHSGGTPGFLSQMYMHRNSKTGVILFINERYQNPILKGFAPFRTFAYKAIMKILFIKASNVDINQQNK